MSTQSLFERDASGAPADRETFRVRLRCWLEANIPADWMKRMSGASQEEHAKLQRQWYGRLADAGLATAHWPKQWGGVELPLGHQVVVYEEMARLNAPTVS